MSGPATDSIVRVLDGNGRTVGAGFLVHSDGLIATCAHVVTAAGAEPGGTVGVTFMGDEETLDALVEPEWWRPEGTQDVALLRVRASLPGSAAVLPLMRAAGAAGRRFRTFGFPAAKPVEGMWGYGVVGDPLPGEPGWLQLRDATDLTQGYSGAPLVDEATGWALGMVGAVTRADRFGRQSAAAFAVMTEVFLEICPLLRASAERPYRSLEFFDVHHARYFFGRERDLARLLDRLRGQPRFLAVLGPSGSGKSSLLHAGLAAALLSGALPGSRRWGVVSGRLAADGILRAADLPDGARIAEAVDAYLRERPELTRCVLIIDQFEELFVEATPARAAGFFAEVDALLESDRPMSLIIGMRDDFYSRLVLDARGFVDRIERGLVNVSPTIDAGSLRDIITKPAASAGLRFEPGLVETIVKETVDGSLTGDEAVRAAPSTVLPLLEFALTQMWELRADEVLTHDAYQEVGGVTGGLAQWADRAYYGLAAESRPLARRTFTDLIHLGDESRNIPDSRQRRRLATLLRSDAEKDAVRGVIASLTAARLLVTSADRRNGGETVELIHDALLREWDMLRAWLQEDRRFLLWQQELDRGARTWIASAPDSAAERDEGRLVRGRDLDVAEEMLGERPGDLTASQRDYIVASVAARDRQREHERALRAEAESQRLSALRRQVAMELREQAARSAEVAASDPAYALMLAIGAVGAHVDRLPGEPTGPVLAALHTAVHGARERLVLGGHTSCVRAVAFGPGGRLVSAGDDRTLRLWNTDDGAPVTVIEGHDDYIAAMAISPGGHHIVSAGGDLTLRLWNAHGDPVRTWHSGHEDAVTAVAFGPGGRLVSAGEDRTLRLWNTDDGAPVTVIEGHDDHIAAMAISPGGHHIVSAGGDLTLRLWDAHGDPVRTWHSGHEDVVMAVAFSPDGELLASAGRDPVLRLWAVDGTPVSSWDSGHGGAVISVCFAPDGQAIVTVGADGTVRVHDRQGRRAADPLPGHQGEVTALAIAPGGRAIATGGVDRTVRVWDFRPALPPDRPSVPVRRAVSGARSGGLQHARHPWDENGCQVMPAWRGHQERVFSVAFAPDGTVVASASADRTIRLWNLRGEEIADPFEGHDGTVYAVGFSPDGRLLASAGSDNSAGLWDVATGVLLRRLEGPRNLLSAVDFSPDGEVVAGAGRDGTIRLWRLDGSPVGEPFGQAHESHIRAVRFSPDGALLASAGDDGGVRLWATAGGGTPAPLPGRMTHQGPALAVAFSPDGKALVSGGADRTLRWWPIGERPGEDAQVSQGHTGPVQALAFSPDGGLVLSGGADRALRLWDRAGNPVSRPLLGHDVEVTSVAVHPEGRFLLSGGGDTTVRLWTGGGWRDWVRDACARLRSHPRFTAETDDADIAAAYRVCDSGIPGRHSLE